MDVNAIIDGIKKVFDFLAGVDFAGAFRTIGDALVKVVTWIAGMAA